MKKFTKIAGITALAAVIGVSLICCGGGGVSVSNLTKHLASLDQKTVDTPTTVKLAKTTFTTAFPAPEGATAWAEINNIVKSAEKYVILDLSACTATDNTITGSSNLEHNDMNIIKGNSYVAGIILPLNLASVGDRAFADCDNLTTITIPDSVTTIGYLAFNDCNNLASATLGAGVTTIGDYAFIGCDRLASITIPDSVTGIGESAFYGCDRLASLTLGAGVTTIGASAFQDCAGLTAITIPASVTTIGEQALTSIPVYIIDRGSDVYVGCEVSVDPANTAYSSADGVLFDKAGTTLIQYPGNKTGNYTIPNGVTTIGERAFVYCEGLSGVTIPDGVTAIPEGAFLYTNLASVTIPASVTTIEGYAFKQTYLTSVTFTGSGVTIADGAFPPDLPMIFLWPGERDSRDHNPLRTAYTNGGPGTYTRASNSIAWRKSN